MRLTDFDALSFDCYGTLIDWEAGIAAVLSRWAASRRLDTGAEALLAAYSQQVAAAEAGHPRPRPGAGRRGQRAGRQRARGLGARLAGLRRFP